MSAALQLPVLWGAASTETVWSEIRKKRQEEPAALADDVEEEEAPEQGPDTSLAFYRKHTENLLRRYMYASMLVGRAPELLSDSVGRGWVSSRPVRTFEDAVIFVLDVEKCLKRLNPFDRKMLSRIVLQDYTQVEAAEMLGIGVRTIGYKFPQAIDRLTQFLLNAGLLALPH